MAIVTTVGSASANSYITVAEYEAFWTERNVTIPGRTAPKKAQPVQAADYIKRGYNFVGEQQFKEQAMVWPRLTGIILVKDFPIDPDTVPQDIKDAQAELAYIIHQGTDVFATVTGGAKVREKNKAGPVETEIEFTNFRETPRFVAIEGLLSPYTIYGGAQLRMVRG